MEKWKIKEVRVEDNNMNSYPPLYVLLTNGIKDFFGVFNFEQDNGISLRNFDLYNINNSFDFNNVNFYDAASINLKDLVDFGVQIELPINVLRSKYEELYYSFRVKYLEAIKIKKIENYNNNILVKEFNNLALNSNGVILVNNIEVALKITSLEEYVEKDEIIYIEVTLPKYKTLEYNTNIRKAYDKLEVYLDKYLKYKGLWNTLLKVVEHYNKECTDIDNKLAKEVKKANILNTLNSLFPNEIIEFRTEWHRTGTKNYEGGYIVNSYEFRVNSNEYEKQLNINYDNDMFIVNGLPGKYTLEQFQELLTLVKAANIVK